MSPLSAPESILAVYDRATRADRRAGREWYGKAHAWSERLADRYQIPVSAAAGVIAALSPGLEWLRNVQDAYTLTLAWSRGEDIPTVGTYGRRNVQKAVDILQGFEPLDILGGHKVRSFYGNIIDPTNVVPVTIDRHAKSLALSLASGRTGAASVDTIVTASEYEGLAELYREAASRLHLVPNQLQAITWIAWKRLAE